MHVESKWKHDVDPYICPYIDIYIYICINVFGCVQSRWLDSAKNCYIVTPGGLTLVELSILTMAAGPW